MKNNVGVKRLVTALMISCLLLPQSLLAAKAVDESPNEWAMVGDLLVARPVGLVLTVGGAAVWLVSLPFTLLAGHAGEAAETLVLGPERARLCAAWVVVIPVIPIRMWIQFAPLERRANRAS